MGQMIDEEDCEVCEVFDQDWIFTYGDLVTLLLCFFILLFSMCRIDDEKIAEVSQSFKPSPPGTPFVFSGKRSVLEAVARKLEQLDMPDDVTINVSEEGVEISIKETVLFEAGSAELTDEAKESLLTLTAVITSLPNDILVEGHTDNETDTNSKYPSNWEFSAARASSIASYFEFLGIDGKRLQVSGYGGIRPRFYNDTAYKRSLNRRVDIMLLPEDQSR